ncbi:MAG: cell division protein FtsQ/DivIB, partial [Janthinobacterium lividum]
MWHDVKTLNASANGLVGLVLLAVLASGVWWVVQRPVFTLKEIRIEGTAAAPVRYVSASTIRATALPRINGNFFTANLDAVRSAFEAVPWVRRASVRREWPDKLVVAVEEFKPLGTWGEDGKLISVQGDIFTANLAEAEEDGALPEFDGPAGSEREVIARYADMRTWLAPVELVPQAVQLSSRYAWSVKMNNGMVVELGREQTRETLKARVERLAGVYPQLAARLQDRIETVDMRYPNGLAL